MPKLSLKSKALSLPETPGVYFFLTEGKPIYIGKAINLKRRVLSYFDLHLLPKTAKMVSTATEIKHIAVTSELEALLLEAKLIRKYLPHYNIVAKDDKHPLYITITKEELPRIITTRKTGTYGPFPSTRNVFFVLRMIRRIFPYSDHKIGKRACLYNHIGLCNPCPSMIKTAEEKKIYLKNIKSIRSLLNGHIDKLKKDLENEMDHLSKEQKYEEAKEIRSKVERLVYITSPSLPTEYYIENPNLAQDLRTSELRTLKQILQPEFLNLKSLKRIECFDIAHMQGTNATASMVTFINGESEKKFYRHFRIKKARGGDDYSSMAEIAKRRKRHFSDWDKPDLIIVDGGLGQVSSFVGEISEVPIVGISKHPDRLIIGNKKIRLKGESLNLIGRIRDEAHRFARVYHHKLMSKSYMLSLNK